MSISRDVLSKPLSKPAPKKKQDNLRITCYGCLAIFVVFTIIVCISGKLWEIRYANKPPEVTTKPWQPPGFDPKYEYDISSESLGMAIYKTEQEAYDEIEGLLKLEIKYEGSDIYFVLVTEAVTPKELEYIIWKAISTYTYNLCSVCPAVDKPNRNYYSHYYINYTVHVICIHAGEKEPYWQFVKPFGESFPYSSIDDNITNLK